MEKGLRDRIARPVMAVMDEVRWAPATRASGRLRVGSNAEEVGRLGSGADVGGEGAAKPKSTFGIIETRCGGGAEAMACTTSNGPKPSCAEDNGARLPASLSLGGVASEAGDARSRAPPLRGEGNCPSTARCLRWGSLSAAGPRRLPQEGPGGNRKSQWVEAEMRPARTQRVKMRRRADNQVRRANAWQAAPQLGKGADDGRVALAQHVILAGGPIWRWPRKFRRRRG